jgi:hypothetical protein
MHHIEHESTVLLRCRVVHSDFGLLRTGQLGGEGGRFAEDGDSALSVPSDSTL